jgi:hypothetical protein
MGFNKRYLPEVEKLQETLDRLGDDLFYKIYVESPDAVIGSTDSFEFVEQFVKRYEDSKLIQEKK